MAATARIVVAGGGLAALEFLLALREAAGDSVDMTLIAPDEHLLIRPALVAEPLGAAPARRHALQPIADDIGFTLVRAALASVDADRREAVLRGGGTLPYDTLVLAPGARRLPAYDGAVHLGDEDGTRGLEALRDEVARGAVRQVAFVAPSLTGWLLPLYEAALLTARLHPDAEVTLVSVEPQPLTLFGTDASAAVAAALARARVRFLGGRRSEVTDGAVITRGATTEVVPAERVVSLPLLRGPAIPGVPRTGVYGLIPVDGYGRVPGLAGVYAIGDATTFPLKQGGIACQQADVAAAQIAGRSPAPFEPRLAAVLLTGEEPIVLGDATAKLPGRHLTAYLGEAAAALR